MSPRRLLVVEDNPPDAEFVAALLDDVGTPVDLEVVLDGEAAAARLLDERAPLPDLVLLDVNLPKLSGHEVLQRLRASARGRRVPVVVLSTSAASADIERATANGATAYVTKPLGVDEAIDTILTTLRFWLRCAYRG